MEWLRYEMEGLNHWRIDEKYDSNGGGIGLDDAFRIQRYYVNGPGQLGQIVKAHVFTYPNNTTNQSSANTDYYYGYDVLGNVSVISGSNGAEADQFEQDAFGNQVEGSWSGDLGDTITERLTTKQFDADLGPNGLYYFNARWYDPVTGAFASRDMGVQSMLEWQTPYQFCRGNPLGWYDANGLEPKPMDPVTDEYLESVLKKLCANLSEYVRIKNLLKDPKLTAAERKALLSRLDGYRWAIWEGITILDTYSARLPFLPTVRAFLRKYAIAGCCGKVLDKLFPFAQYPKLAVIFGWWVAVPIDLILNPNDMGGWNTCPNCDEGTGHPSALYYTCGHLYIDPMGPTYNPPNPSSGPPSSPPGPGVGAPEPPNLMVCPTIIGG